MYGIVEICKLYDLIINIYDINKIILYLYL